MAPREKGKGQPGGCGFGKGGGKGVKGGSGKGQGPKFGTCYSCGGDHFERHCLQKGKGKCGGGFKALGEYEYEYGYGEQNNMGWEPPGVQRLAAINTIKPNPNEEHEKLKVDDCRGPLVTGCKCDSGSCTAHKEWKTFPETCRTLRRSQGHSGRKS